MPYSASVIAYAFVLKGIEENKFVTQLHLQKMVYFAHGYHLAKYGIPLIAEDFQAWQFGPVVQSIYRDYKAYGSSPIKDLNFINEVSANYQKIALDEQAKDAINYTWEALKDLSVSALVKWTHMEDGPWQNVYNPDETHTRIPNDLIKDYFAKILIEGN